MGSKTRALVRRRDWLVVLAMAGGLALIGWRLVRHDDRSHEAATVSDATSAIWRSTNHPIHEARAARVAVTVIGTVRDPAGGPVEGARVVASATSGLSARQRAAPDPLSVEEASVAITGSDGRYELRGLEPGVFNLTATSIYFTAASRPNVMLTLGAPQTVDLQLGSDGGSLSGRLVDSGGGPIPEGQVLAVPYGTERVYSVLTDKNGRFRLRLRRGRYGVVGRANGYSRSFTWILVLGDETCEIRLHPAARVSGQVVTDTGSVVARAQVVLTASDRKSSDRRQADTDSAGAFEFSDLAPGAYELVARAGPLVGRYAGRIAVEMAEAATGLRVVVRSGRRVAGRVETSAGQPLAGALVSVTPQMTFAQAKDQVRVHADAHGAFVVQGLLPGRFELDAEAPGATSQHLAIAVGRTDIEGIRLVLRPAAVVVGRVVDQSSVGVSEASVAAAIKADAYGEDQLEIVSTGLTGEFRFEGLKEGPLYLSTQHGEGAAQLGPEPLTAGETKRIVLRLNRGVTVTGHVRFADGTPAANVDVRARAGVGVSMSDGAAPMPSVSTSADGTYRLRGLLAGELLVVAALPGQESRRDPAPHANFARLHVSAGQHVDDVDLVVRRNDLTIAGVVADDKGRPVVGAVVSAGPEILRGLATEVVYKHLVTGTDGRFAITNVSDGSYTVWAAHPNFPNTEKKGVAAGEKNLQLTFKSPVTIAGRALTAEGAPVPAYDVLLLTGAKPGESIEEKDLRLWGEGSQRKTVLDPTGAFTFPGLEPGVYDLSVTTADHFAGTVLGVRVDETSRREDVRIVIRKAATLRGKVVEYGTGRPMPSVRIMTSGTGLDLQTTADESGRFELVGVPTGEVANIYVVGSLQTHVRENAEITVPPDAGDVDVPDIKLQPGRLDWTSPDAGFTGLAPVTRDGHPTVRTLRPGYPAAAAGVRRDDLILSVSGHPVTAAGASTVDYLLRGRAGEPITLVVQTPGTEPREVTFMRIGR